MPIDPLPSPSPFGRSALLPPVYVLTRWRDVEALATRVRLPALEPGECLVFWTGVLPDSPAWGQLFPATLPAEKFRDDLVTNLGAPSLGACQPRAVYFGEKAA